MGIAENLEALLAKGQDSSALRLGLAAEYLKRGQAEAAALHLRAALARDPTYSAAWKHLGAALTQLDRRDEAIDAYTRGIAAAEARGDVQAAKEMRVFLKRLQRAP